MTTADTQYTNAELASLSPDERIALEAEDGGDTEYLAELAAREADQDGTTINTEDEDASTGTANAGTDTGGADGDEPTTATAFAPAFVAEAPADATAQLETLKTAKAEAKAELDTALDKLMDGEIDQTQYKAAKAAAEAKIDEIDEQRITLREAVSRSKIAADMAEQQLSRAYDVEVKNLVKTGAAEGFDYAKDAKLNAELNRLVKAFGMEATEAGLTDADLAASKWALQQAHITMKTRHPELVKTAPKPVKSDLSPQEAQKARHNLRTLGGLPSADRAQGDDDAVQEFSGLVGDDIERKMASMSQAEIKKLMASV